MQQIILIWCTAFSCVFSSVADYLPDYPHKNARKVAYACENSYIHLRCTGPGERIRIFLANYGRFSLVVCNQDGVHKGWNLQCSSKLSLQLVEQKCDGQRNCTFNVSSTLFGDPCPDTKKYIEVQYYCEKVHNIENAITIQNLSSGGFSSSSGGFSSSSGGFSSSSGGFSSSSGGFSNNVYTETTTLESTIKVETDEQLVQKYCEYTEQGTFVWERTPTGDIATSKCSKGVAKKWLCGMDGQWIGDPDIFFCDHGTKTVSPWMNEIQDLINSDTPVEKTMDHLNSNLHGKTLSAEDLKMASTTVLPRLIKMMKLQMSKEMTAEERKQKVHKINKEMVKSGSHLLDDSHQDLWKNLNPAEQKKSATSLIMSFETMAHEIAATMGTSDIVSSSELNLVMEVSIISMNKITSQDLKLPIMQYGNDTSSSLHEISLPLDGIGHYLSVKDEVAVTYMFYNNIEVLMSPSTMQAQAPDSTQSINSNVISASVFKRTPTVDNLSNKIHLERPMNFTLSHTFNTTDVVPICAYWHYNESTLTGEWLTDGCRVVVTTPRYTTCQCDHLTNFAVLMDVTSTKLSRIHELSLKAITYVGCAISIICLCLCLLSFTLFRNLQSDRNTIHKNLVLCLMIAELLFVFGIGQTANKVRCGVIAGFLHFFFLTSFSWMCLEGIQLYFMLIEVFEAERSRVRWFYAFGYGVPALIVAIAATVDHTSYGTDTSCWLQTKNYFILSFVIPAAVVVLINMVMLSIVVYMMCWHAGVTASSVKAHKIGTLEKMNTWLKGAAVLVVLLGLTWIFGFLYINQDTIAMAYIFTILNSLQGLFIFIFHCFMDRKVKKEWRRAIYRATWLPQCCRINIGGYNGQLSSPSPTSSSGPQNYFKRLWTRKRKQSSTTSVTARDRRSDLESFLNTDTSSGGTAKTGLNHYSNQSDKLLPNGQNVYTAMPTHHEDGIIGDLSVIDCSIVDSENVTEYCINEMQVLTADQYRYSSASEDSIKDGNCNVSFDNISKNRLSLLSTDSYLRNCSEFTSDNEEGRINHAALHANNDDSPVSNQNNKTDHISEQNKLNDLLTLYQSSQVKANEKYIADKKHVTKETSDSIENKTRSAPDLKHSFSNMTYQEKADPSSQPLLGSLPNLSTIHEDNEDEFKMPCGKSTDVVFKQ